ncbi:MAG: M6 family metalloprotease domain-containing protein [Gemmatimonadetes bacterium]|nr:M6 family metalloprotease domain-containing protein [Gemmatimonadota bacterium]
MSARLRALGYGLAMGAVVTGVTAFHAEAQDIAAAAEIRGLSLPAAYYEQVRVDPTAYEFSRALFARSAPERTPAAGPVRLPVVLALFADSPPTPSITRAMVQASLFDGPSPYGTMTDAYREISRGALDVRGDVLPWVRTSYTLAQVVGASDGLGNDGQVGPYFREALDSLDATVDFAVYDSDGPDGISNSGDDDGFVDVITFEYLEVAASCGGPSIWPHRWTLGARLGAPYKTKDVGARGDTIRINDYITQGATDCSGLGVQGAGTLAHEFGYALGLADYYHWIDFNAGARGRRWVLGCWELMAAGSWGCGAVDDPTGAFGPTHLSAPLKQQLGWSRYIDVGEVWNQEFVLPSIQSSGVALRVPMGGDGTEFLIAEYRARSGFDQALPAQGVLFYKQDTDAARQPDPTSGAPYYLSVLERDGNRGLLKTHFEGGNRGEAGDVWGVGGGANELHALSVPALRLSNGAAASVTVHEVSVVNGQARLVLSTSAIPRLVPPAVPISSLPASLRIAGGTMPYTVVGSSTEGVLLAVSGDDITLSGPTATGGAVQVVVSVTDAAGTASAPLVAWAAGSFVWEVEVSELLRPLLGSQGPPISYGQADYLDAAGNANGDYDVGDLRKWLRTHAP